MLPKYSARQWSCQGLARLMRNELLETVESTLSPVNSVLLGYDDESGLRHDYEVWLERLAPHAPIDQCRPRGRAGLETGCTTVPSKLGKPSRGGFAPHQSVSITAQLETQAGAKVRVGSWLSPGQSVGRHISLPSAHRQALRLFL
jgi:hypothetical protein